MSSKIYKKITVVGCSPESIEKAIEAGVAKAGENLHGLSWFEVKELRGSINANKVAEWQVTFDIGFKVD